MASTADDNLLFLHAEAAKKVNAHYANRVFAQPLGEGMVRISFGEMSDPYDPVYHSAIVVTPAQALDIAEVVQRVALTALQHQQEMAEAERAAQEAAEQFAKEHPPAEQTLGETLADILKKSQDGSGRP